MISNVSGPNITVGFIIIKIIYPPFFKAGPDLPAFQYFFIESENRPFGIICWRGPELLLAVKAQGRIGLDRAADSKNGRPAPDPPVIHLIITENIKNAPAEITFDPDQSGVTFCAEGTLEPGRADIQQAD